MTPGGAGGTGGLGGKGGEGGHRNSDQYCELPGPGILAVMGPYAIREVAQGSPNRRSRISLSAELGPSDGVNDCTNAAADSGP